MPSKANQLEAKNFVIEDSKSAIDWSQQSHSHAIGYKTTLSVLGTAHNNNLALTFGKFNMATTVVEKVELAMDLETVVSLSNFPTVVIERPAYIFVHEGYKSQHVGSRVTWLDCESTDRVLVDCAQGIQRLTLELKGTKERAAHVLAPWLKACSPESRAASAQAHVPPAAPLAASATKARVAAAKSAHPLAALCKQFRVQAAASTQPPTALVDKARVAAAASAQPLAGSANAAPAAGAAETTPSETAPATDALKRPLQDISADAPGATLCTNEPAPQPKPRKDDPLDESVPTVTGEQAKKQKTAAVAAPHGDGVAVA